MSVFKKEGPIEIQDFRFGFGFHVFNAKPFKKTTHLTILMFILDVKEGVLGFWGFGEIGRAHV